MRRKYTYCHYLCVTMEKFLRIYFSFLLYSKGLHCKYGKLFYSFGNFIENWKFHQKFEISLKIGNQTSFVNKRKEKFESLWVFLWGFLNMNLGLSTKNSQRYFHKSNEKKKKITRHQIEKFSITVNLNLIWKKKIYFIWKITKTEFSQSFD